VSDASPPRLAWGEADIVAHVSPEFLITSLAVVLIPGTGVIYTVASSLAGGQRRGIFAAIGCTLGIVPHLLAAMLGLSGIMQAGATAFELVRWAGVVYLAYLGLTMILGRGNLRLDAREPSAESMSLVVRRGILLNLLNPKLTLFFFAFLPQFLDSAPELFDGRLMLLGGVFMLMTLVVFAGYAVLSAAIRDRLLGRPAALTWLQRSLGALLLGFAARLALTDR
jgi:threonine/homoserine/homoserine lactone efflux protein